ncbi:hypothetical protein UB32_02600 [Mesobacillus subterraneus]|uniref:Uncharacterized protein n=1 Tax=Mesobacillus subterraneus TaxID=285983 RepID=A0A0D6ZCJ2_9BACI|nr:hypothetical protein UB32_02600 [Mesobacillus subterraneus]
MKKGQEQKTVAKEGAGEFDAEEKNAEERVLATFASSKSLANFSSRKRSFTNAILLSSVSILAILTMMIYFIGDFHNFIGDTQFFLLPQSGRTGSFLKLLFRLKFVILC